MTIMSIKIQEAHNTKYIQLQTSKRFIFLIMFLISMKCMLSSAVFSLVSFVVGVLQFYNHFLLDFCDFVLSVCVWAAVSCLQASMISNSGITIHSVFMNTK